MIQITKNPLFLLIGRQALFFLNILLFIIGACFIFSQQSVIFGWILIVISFLLNFFLLRLKFKIFHVFSLLLFFALCSVLVLLLIYHFLKIKGDVLFFIPFIIFLNLTAVYFLNVVQKKMLKVLGIIAYFFIIILTVIFMLASATTRSELVTSLILALMSFGIGIFLISRKSIILRFLGVGIIVLSLLGFFFVFYMPRQPVAVSEIKKETIEAEVRPIIDNLLAGFNEKNYEKFTHDFAQPVKDKLNKEKFLEANDSFGQYISRKKPEIGKQGPMTVIVYKAKFSKVPDIKLTFTLVKPNSHYNIQGLEFVPVTASQQ